jgi:xanthine dehydrogenase accessory factor
VLGQAGERVLRAPADGEYQALSEIGRLLHAGDPVARVAGQTVSAPFDGILRGLLQTGLFVRAGMKIGDVDPRNDPRLCWMVSEKALAVGGGVLEAVLTWFSRRRTR